MKRHGEVLAIRQHKVQGPALCSPCDAATALSNTQTEGRIFGPKLTDLIFHLLTFKVFRISLFSDVTENAYISVRSLDFLLPLNIEGMRQ